MHNARCFVFTALLIVSFATGCDLLKKGKTEDSVSAATEAPRPLQDIELPVSLRHGDSLPGDARRLEASDQQLSLEGTVIASLTKGRVAPSEQSNGVIPKLESALGGRGSSIALRFQANVPYETVALVMSTARKVGISNTVIQVRPTGSSQETGWLAIDGYVMSSKADDLPPITSVKARSWDDFGDKWQETFDGCHTSPNGNCAYVSGNIAEGGTLKMELMASGRGININFFRRGLTTQQEVQEDKVRAQILARKKEDFLQGHITHDEMVEVLLLGDPSTYALFQFRYQEALKTGSALSKTMAPMCHKERCGMVLTADVITPLLNVVSMIGAAFPDGTQMPAFAIEMPWTERPKPAVLAEFIAQQMAK